MSRLPLFAGTVLRGIRARALLSGGSVLLTVLAIGSAVLGPIFATAVTNSYVVSRLDAAPDIFTGLSWTLTPTATTSSPEAALAAAVKAADARNAGPFSAPTATLETTRFPALTGQAMLLAKAGACEHLRVTGRCPARAGEVLMLGADLAYLGKHVGDTVDLGTGLGPATVVGSYTSPTGQSDYWYDTGRLVSLPAYAKPRGPSMPYEPAPLIVTPTTFAKLPVSRWRVLVDSRLSVPPGLTVTDLDRAVRTAKDLTHGPAQVAGGTLTPAELNDLKDIAKDVRAQQATARSSIAPAVLSLVLVALALLLRLLTAASELRLPELALASLRGLTGRQLWGLGLAEPLALLALAVPLGAAAGYGFAVLLIRSWLVPGLPVPLPVASPVSAVLVVLAALAVAVLAVWLVLRVALSEQLTGVRRPGGTSRAPLIATLLLVALAVAVLASKLASGGQGDPDSTDLVLPVLLAVVAGLGMTRLTAALAKAWTRRRTSRSLAGFVASRAISRRREATLVILPITAAIAVSVFAAGVYASASTWRQSVAATVAPAGQVWSSSLPLNQTVDAARLLDPSGRWLMGAGVAAYPGGTFSVVDTPRLARVAQWPKQWTPGSSAADVARMIGPTATVPTLTGRRLAVTVDRQGRASDDVWLVLQLDVPGHEPQNAYLGPYAAGTSTRSTTIPCATGCRLRAMTIGRAAGLTVDIKGSLAIGDVRVDGRSVPDAVGGAGWTGDRTEFPALTGVGTSAGRLHVGLDTHGQETTVTLLAGGIAPRRPVLVGVDAGSSVHHGRSGSYVPVTEGRLRIRSLGAAASTPFLGPGGILVDYTTLSVDHAVDGQIYTSYVLARSDTPPAIERRLADRFTRTEGFAAVRHTLDDSAYALALRLYAVVAGLVLLMALAGLVVSTAVQLPARRRDAAALRVVGMRRPAVMSAVARELAVVLGSAAVAGIAAGLLAQYVVLRTVRLGYAEGLNTPHLVTSLDLARLALLALVAVVVLGIISFTTASLTVRGARGSTLRETAR
jgi:hypothetical protein